MFLISILYFLSRLPFLRAYSVYYDSFEYSSLAEKINLFNFSQIIASSHQPIHTFYFLTILFLKQIFSFLPTGTILILISLIFGYLTIVFWYLFAKDYFNTKIAKFPSFLLLLFPYFFLVNTNILYESELLFFQIGAIYFLNKGLKTYGLRFIVLAGIFWGISISVFTGSLFLLPIFLLLVHQSLIRRSLFLFFLIPAIIAPLILDLAVFQNLQLVLVKYQLHFGDLPSATNGLPLLILRTLRNVVLESSAILSLPVVILVFLLSLFSFLRFLPPYPSSLIIWFLPPLILMQFWHSGLFGRLGLFIIFPVSLILAKNLKIFWQKSLILLFLLILLVPLLFSQARKPPIYLYYELIKNEKNIVIITTDYNRFLYEKANLPIFILKNKEDLPSLENFIQNNLKENRKVLIDSMAINFPNFQFDGDSYHPLTENNSKTPLINPILEKYQTEDFKTDIKDKKNFLKRIYN